MSDELNWSRCAATHQLYSIRLSCSEKHTSQPLSMPPGYFLDLTFEPVSQIKTVDMYWTGGGGGHSFNEPHGLADLHTDASSTSTWSMERTRTEMPCSI